MNPPDQYKALLITRSNIITVLSLSIKDLVDTPFTQDSVDDFRFHVMNFLTILEHVIYFCAKGSGFVFSEKIHQHPWKLFSVFCNSIAHNCLSTIKQLDNLTSDFGRMRAVFRMGLMEKRLHEYFAVAFSNRSTNSKFYMPHSIILSGHLPTIINELSGLSVVDFSFDLKANMNHQGFYPIDYSVYLTAGGSHRSMSDPISDCRSCNDNGNYCSSHNKYEILLAKVKVDSEQKGYLEEIVVNRDSKILALENRNEILISEIQALENSVTDFQIQLTLLHEQFSKEIEKLGGNSTVLNAPSVKSVVGSRADFLSSRHPLMNEFSQIEASISNDIVKDSNPYMSPLPQLAPFSFSTESIQDCYAKLSKMAASTNDVHSKASSTSLENNQGKFIIGRQLISISTQRYYSPKSEANRKFSVNSNLEGHKAAAGDIENNNSEYTSRLFDMQFDEQRSRIMESQQLRKIMGQACRSPKIKALRRTNQNVDMTKSQSFDRADSYFVDEMSNSFNGSNSFDDNVSPSSRIVVLHSPDDETNYYHLSNNAAFDSDGNEDLEDYFDVHSDRVHSDIVHLDPPRSVGSNDMIQLFPPSTALRQNAIVTSEVPYDVQPLADQRPEYGSSDNFINGDRGSAGSRHDQGPDGV